jgi:hypothetical protein
MRSHFIKWVHDILYFIFIHFCTHQITQEDDSKSKRAAKATSYFINNKRCANGVK